MKSLTEYATLVQENKNNPSFLSDLHLELAAKYAFLSETAKDIVVEKAEFWNMKFAGEKPLSDTHIETKWNQTETGKKELRLKYELKALEKLMSAIKSSIVVSSVEAKNQG